MKSLLSKLRAMFQIVADSLLEVRISKAANRDMSIPANWTRFVDLVNKRSPDRIQKMEAERGLNA